MVNNFRQISPRADLVKLLVKSLGQLGVPAIIVRYTSHYVRVTLKNKAPNVNSKLLGKDLHLFVRKEPIKGNKGNLLLRASTSETLGRVRNQEQPRQNDVETFKVCYDVPSAANHQWQPIVYANTQERLLQHLSTACRAAGHVPQRKEQKLTLVA